MFVDFAECEVNRIGGSIFFGFVFCNGNHLPHQHYVCWQWNNFISVFGNILLLALTIFVYVLFILHSKFLVYLFIGHNLWHINVIDESVSSLWQNNMANFSRRTTSPPPPPPFSKYTLHKQWITFYYKTIVIKYADKRKKIEWKKKVIATG